MLTESMDETMIKADGLTYSDLSPGDKLKVTVLSVKNKGVLVEVNPSLKAFIPLMYVHDTVSNNTCHKVRLKQDDVISARVLHVIAQKRQLLLTCRPSLLYMTEPVVSELSSEYVGTLTKGILIVIKESEDLLSVKLFGNAKGDIAWSCVEEVARKKLCEGQTVDVKICGYEKSLKKYQLTLVTSSSQSHSPQKSLKTTGAKVGKIGSTHNGEVIDKTESGLLIRVANCGITASLPVHHLSDFDSLSRLLLRDVTVGSQVGGLFLVNHGTEATDHLPLVSLKETWKKLEKQILKATTQNIKPGMVLPAMVSSVNNGIVTLQSPIAAIPNIRVYVESEAQEESLKEGSSMYVSIRKCKPTHVIATIPSKDCKENLECSRMYIRQVHVATKYMGESVAGPEELYSRVFPGQRIRGNVTSVTSSQLKIKLHNGLTAIVLPINYPDPVPVVGSPCEAVVVCVDVQKKQLYMTLSAKVIAHTFTKHKDLISELIKQKYRVTCRVVHESDVLAIGEMESGALIAIPAVHHFNRHDHQRYTIGEQLQLKLKKYKKVNFMIGVPSSAKKVNTNIWEMPSMEFTEDLTSNKKRKKETMENENAVELDSKRRKFTDQDEEEDPEEDSSEGKPKKKKKKKRKLSGTSSIEDEETSQPAVTEVEDTGSHMDEDKDMDDQKSFLKLDAEFEWNPVQNDDAQSSDEETTEQTKKPLSKGAQKALARREEEEIWEKERSLMTNDQLPMSVGDFERLLLSKPNSSLCWIQYMGFYLQAAEIDRARSVARRALNTIGFREEREKLDVWFALLNLENLYGTEESLEITLKEALQMNEQLPVYKYVCDMYNESDKREAAETMYNKMARKFRHQKEVWLRFGDFYMKRGQMEAARDVMQRSLQSLDRVHHVDIISKFAQMEFKYGEKERGKTLYESLLKTYPKRTDLWTVFTDTLLKLQDFNGARHLMARATSLQLPPKKMRTLFKKYLEIELEHGTDESVEQVRSKAALYVQER